MSHHAVEIVDDKTILLDGVRYIRSWKGTKPSRQQSREERNDHMKAYRTAKRHEMLCLQKQNLELEEQILTLLKKK